MSDDLFRTEAALARQGEWLGSIYLQPPPAGWIFIGSGLAALAGTILVLCLGTYTTYENVNGALILAGGSLIITAPSPGGIKRLLVSEGDSVTTGQPLIEIGSERASVDLGETHAAIRAQLTLQRNELEADASELDRLDSLQLRELKDRVSRLQEQRLATSSQIELQKQRADQASTIFNLWSQAQPGAVSKFQLSQQHDAALQAELQLQDLVKQKSQFDDQLQQLRTQVAQLPSMALVKHGETKRQLADIAKSLALNASDNAIFINAPVDGVVVNLTVHPGQEVTAQQLLATVLPSGSQSELLAELWVPTRSIGFIRPGKAVVIKYDAFPYQTYGQQTGSVKSVGSSAVSPSEVSRVLGQSIQEPRYRVQVQLHNQSMPVGGHLETLKPGMTLQAAVLLDRRRLLDWAVESFNGTRKPPSLNQSLGSKY